MERSLTNASIFRVNRSHKRIRNVTDILPDGISQAHPVSGFSPSRAHPGLALADDTIQRFSGLFSAFDIPSGQLLSVPKYLSMQAA